MSKKHHGNGVHGTLTVTATGNSEPYSYYNEKLGRTIHSRVFEHNVVYHGPSGTHQFTMHSGGLRENTSAYKGHNGPIQNGVYRVVGTETTINMHLPGGKDAPYPAWRIEGNTGDRSGFYIHPGYASRGCLTMSQGQVESFFDLLHQERGTHSKRHGRSHDSGRGMSSRGWSGGSDGGIDSFPSRDRSPVQSWSNSGKGSGISGWNNDEPQEFEHRKPAGSLKDKKHKPQHHQETRGDSWFGFDVEEQGAKLRGANVSKSRGDYDHQPKSPGRGHGKPKQENNNIDSWRSNH